MTDLGLGFLVGLVVGFWAGLLALAVFVSGKRRPDPNPFGELPPTQPNGDCGHACEYVAPYGFVPEADCPVHDPPAPPKLERAIWLATLDPVTREPNGGALPVAIRQNANIHARN